MTLIHSAAHKIQNTLIHSAAHKIQNTLIHSAAHSVQFSSVFRLCNIVDLDIFMYIFVCKKKGCSLSSRWVGCMVGDNESGYDTNQGAIHIGRNTE